MQPQFYFHIQTMDVMDGAKLKALHPDKDGYYKDVPLLVIGKASRNMKYYDDRSLLENITNPNSRFYINLTEGNLLGEYGHPIVLKNEDLMRMAIIEMTRVSHSIRRVYTKDVNGDVVMFGDIKPCGPMGQYLKESLEDSTRNTSFSLRSICAKISQDGAVLRQRVLSLVTIDAVDGPGYKIASKRYANQGVAQMSNEGLDYYIPEELMSSQHEINDLIGVESITNEAVMDLFGTDKVKVFSTEELICDVHANKLIGANGQQSIFHTLFK